MSVELTTGSLHVVTYHASGSSGEVTYVGILTGDADEVGTPDESVGISDVLELNSFGDVVGSRDLLMVAAASRPSGYGACTVQGGEQDYARLVWAERQSMAVDQAVADARSALAAAEAEAARIEAVARVELARQEG